MSADAPPAAIRPRGVGVVLLAGAAVEVAVLLALLPPLWLFSPSKRAALHTFEPLAALLGANAIGVARLALVCAVWIGGYAAALWLARGPLTPGARRALLALPVLFAGTLLFTLPASSNDVYHYLMEGRILAVYGDNPLRVPPNAYADDPLAWVITSWGDEPSRYGPAFNLPAGLIGRSAGDSFAVQVISYKLLMITCLAGTAALTYLTLRRVRPEAALIGAVLVAWNPQALYEAAANAHNDLLMLWWTALALYLAVRRRWTLAFPALALGVLTKYVVVLLGPVLLAEALARDGRAALRPVLTGISLSAVLVVALYVPFWDGLATFDAVRGASAGMISSPGWLLRQGLKHVLGWQGAQLPVVVLLTATFVLGYAALLWCQVRLAGAAGCGMERLAQAAFWVLVLELCTLSWWLWPWYALWLLPAAALLPRRLPALLAATATSAGLLAYIPINFRGLFWGMRPTDHMPLAVMLTLFLPSIVVAVWWKVRGRWVSLA